MTRGRGAGCWPLRVWLFALLLTLAGAVQAQTYTSSVIPLNWESSVSFTNAPWSNTKDCTGSGSAIDDDITTSIPLGFTFRFGATNYTAVRIQSNGRLHFGSNTFCGFGTQTVGPPPTYPYLYPDGLPGGSASSVANTMRVYGGDLDPSLGGSVKYWSDGAAPNRRFIVTWDSVKEWQQNSSKFELQIILYESGNFDYQYKTFTNPSKGQGQIGWELTATDYGTVPYATISGGNTALRFRRAGSLPTGFRIDVGAASASTCSPKTITVTAIDSGGNAVTSYAGSVTISTSTGRGDWALSSGNGTFSNGAAGDGIATYTFAAADQGVAAFALTNRSAETLTVTVNDAAAAVSSTSAAIQFQDNAFVFTEDPIQVAGRGQAITVTRVAKDGAGNCGTVTTYTGSQAVKAWLTRDALDPGGTAPTIGALSLPNAQPGGTNLTLTFTSGVATFTVATTDVGKYVLNFRDDAPPTPALGASNSITTRPFVLAFTGIQRGATANPGGTATGGTKFTTAGSTFQATVAAYRWSAAADANNDGQPDDPLNGPNTGGGLAPSYRWTTVLQAASTADFSPAGGVLGALTGTTSIAQGSFSGGAVTVTDLAYREVGAVRLRADATGFLGTAGVNVTGLSPRIGRFYPDHFALVSSAHVPGCSSAFTYMGAGNFGFTYTIEAQAFGSNDRLQNYDAALYTIGTATVTMTAKNGTTAGELIGRVTGIPAASFSAGRYVASTTTADFARAASPDNYENLLLGVKLAGDPDHGANTFAALSLLDMNATIAGACSGGTCVAKALNGFSRVRFGRLRVINSSGSQLLPLPVVVEAQYFSLGGFTRNTQDACTTLAAGNFTLSNYQRNLTAGSTVLSLGAATMASGRLTLTMSAPGTGKEGSVDIGINLGSTTAGQFCFGTFPNNTGAARAWLRSRWCSGAFDRDPIGRATFGIYRANDQVLIRRENY